MRRALLCTPLQSGDFADPPPRDLEGRSLQPWLDRYTPAKGRRIWVHAFGPNGEETVDVRELAETLHDFARWPAGTCYEIVVEVDP